MGIERRLRGAASARAGTTSLNAAAGPYPSEGGKARPGTSAGALQYDVAGSRSVVNEAHRMGNKVAARVNGVQALSMAMDAGMDTLARLPIMRYHDLRQRVATPIASQGAPSRLAMEIPGLAQIRTTMNIHTMSRRIRTAKQQRSSGHTSGRGTGLRCCQLRESEV